MLKDLHWPGALVIVALIAGTVLAAIFAPPDLLRPLLGGEGAALALAWWINRSKAPKADEGTGE